MIGLWSKFKAFVIGAVGLLVVGLYVLLDVRTGQRDKQRQRAESAARDHAASEERREEERRLSQGRAEARDFNEQAERERNEKPKETRRTGRLGGTDRVRRFDSQD